MARPLFDGETYDEERDRDRLESQLMSVFHYMQDGEWHSLRQISKALHYPEASISARLRDLRKTRFGAHRVKRRYITKGLWHYKLLAPKVD